MFSTTDAGADRHLHVFAIRPGIRRELAIPPALEERARRAATLPTAGNLRSLARSLATLPTPDEGPLKAVEIQVWSTRYRPSDLKPEARLLRHLRVSYDVR